MKSMLTMRNEKTWDVCFLSKVVAFVAVASMTGCAKSDLVGGSTKQMDVGIPTDTFLPQPQLLSRRDGTLWRLTSIRSDIPPDRYRAILIDPVEILTDANSRLAAVPPEQREQLANTLYSDVSAALHKSCHVALKPGPGVVRVRIALSDATSSNAIVKTVANYTPYVMVAYKVGSRAFNGGVGYFSGNATAEAYATDSSTGQLLWQGVDKRGGTTPLLQNTTDNWLDVHHVFQAWADQFVEKLQSTGICIPNPS